MTIIELIEKAKTRANLPSDYALAKALGISRVIVSTWRRGKAHPSTTEAAQLATLAGLEEMHVIAEIEMQTANTEKKREFWKSYINTKGLTATLGLIALGVTIMVAPEPAQASALQLQNYDARFHVQNADGIYIMRIQEKQKTDLKGFVL